jgi:penicillin-binding protein 2
MTVSTAIENSCNVFFYEMGYRLGGGHNGNVNNSKGLERLKKYAQMFGLTDKSGVEITESQPHFSTEDIVRSCIGQGNHAYAPIQLARYVTTLANSGTCYDLTLIDKIKDVDGNTVVNNSAKVRNKVKISQSTWNAVHRGMYLVVNGSAHGSIFQGLKETVAGKTGTAQQNTLHPNHAYFLSYGPYEDPEVSVSCVIPNGYTSTYAMELARDVYQYYFGEKKISGGKAASVNRYSGTND